METNSRQFFNSVFLAGRKKDSPKDYQPYFHIRSYLRQKYRQSGLAAPELAEACGYKKMDKFKRHQEAWLKVERPVPEKFLEAVGIDPEMLAKVQGLDLDQWEEAVGKATVPESFSARLMPAVWQSVPLPENLSEAQAISYVKEYSRLINRQCRVNYAGLRTAWIWPDGHLSNYYNRPNIEYRNRLVYFTTEATRPGTTGLAGRGS